MGSQAGKGLQACGQPMLSSIWICQGKVEEQEVINVVDAAAG